MKTFRDYLLPLAALIITIVALCAPKTVLATTRVVNPSASSCDSTATTNPCYRTISAALTAAVSGDTIEIHPGTYTGTYTLDKQLTITGTETARTILSGGGSGPIITVSGLSNVIIRKLSFISASTGILIQNSSSVTINNCVFRIGTGTGIDVQSASTAVIQSNTFNANLNAVSFATGTTVTITNNIFTNNTGTAVSTTATANSIHYNCFYGNAANGQTGTDSPTTNVTTDPLFVSTSLGDFHLRSGSPCSHTGDPGVGSNSIDGSTTPDMGAYGGPNADTIPYPVQNVAVNSVVGDPNAARVTWSANTCYQIAGYKIYYDTVPSSYGTTTNPGNVVTYDITGLTPASAPTGTPVLTNSIANNTLLLNWGASVISGATGYEVRYSDTTTPPVSPVVDVGNVASYNLIGLTNGTYYYVSTTPYAQATYYFVVTAYYTNTAFESAYSDEKHLDIGSKAYGTSSNIIYDYPEPITPSPDLPNKGCFIATAAFGYYSAPQVQALREFRDRYLLTNAPGRAFVQWYYRYGPLAADFVNAHPWLKPAVRAALMPAVGGAMFMTRTSLFGKTIIVLVCLLLLGALISCKNYQNKSKRL